jgi:hypothetical protein
MRARWPLLATMLSVGVAYVALPYVTLYRLGSAIRGGDAATLESLVDWPAVREGIKEDVCDFAADEPGPHGSTELPPFGASFVRGIESGAIDHAVTPQALLAAMDLRHGEWRVQRVWLPPELLAPGART